MLRTRRAQGELRHGDRIELYYDPNILKLTVNITPICLFKSNHYSVWIKPAGVLAQGTKFGDHISLLRHVEKELGRTYLIHRLDREVHGLMLLAHSSTAAATFSQMFKEHRIQKIYRATVKGIISEKEATSITLPLDGKTAQTNFQILTRGTDSTDVEIELITGRLHQIRRHFASIQHPVIGDYRYGIKGEGPLRLQAYRLSFGDPFTQKHVLFQLPEER